MLTSTVLNKFLLSFEKHTFFVLLLLAYFYFEYPGTRVLEKKNIEYSSIWMSSSLESLKVSEWVWGTKNLGVF